MKRTHLYVGLDIHKNSTTTTIINKEGKEVLTREISTSKTAVLEVIMEAIDKEGCEIAEVEVSMEVGGPSMEIARFLKGLGIRCHVWDAVEVANKKSKRYKKTDKLDSSWLAEGTKLGMFENEVYVPSEGEARLRRLVSTREELVRRRAELITRVKHMVTSIVSEMKEEGLESKASWEKLMKKLKESGDKTGVEECVEALFEVWKVYTKQIKKIEKRLRREIKEQGLQEEVERLKEIPGVGETTAIAVVSYIGDISRFEDAKHLSSYFGLAPDVMESGDKKKDKGIGKRGNKIVKRLLVQCAQHARRATNPFYVFYSSWVVRIGHKRAVVAVANKLVRVIYAMLSRGERFDLEKLGVKRNERKISKIVYYERIKD